MEKLDNLEGLIADIAEHMDKGAHVDHGLFVSTIVLNDGSGVNIHRHQDKLIITGLYPRGYKPSTNPCISVSVDRSPESIARDIYRRLFPNYIEAYNECIARKRADGDYRRNVTEVLNRLSHTIETPTINDNTLSAYGPRGRYVHVTVSSGVDIRLSLPATDAERVLSALNWKPDPNRYYKVLKRLPNQKLVSSDVSGRPLLVVYRPGVWVDAPVGGLLVFDTLDNATKFTHGQWLEVWECEAMWRVVLPPSRLVSVPADTDTVRALWERKNTRLPTDSWPNGTLAFESVKILNRVA